MTRCTIYARFSPRPDQETSDAGDKQIELCREYARTKGYEVAGVFEDRARSRNDCDRIGLLEAIESLGHGDVLVCYDLSRFGSGGHAVVMEEQIDRRGASLEFVSGVSVADGPETKLLRNIMYQFKEYERWLIQQRCKLRARQQQAAGKRVGARCPYGMMDDPERLEEKMMIPCPEEQEVIEYAMRLHGEGHGLTMICNMVERRYPGRSRNGKPWHPQTMRRILMREGVYSANHEFVRKTLAETRGEQ